MLSNVINHASNQVEGFCFIKSLQLKVNVKGAEYLDIMLADADGEINAKLWDYQSAVHGMYSAGEVIKVRGTINLYKDTLDGSSVVLFETGRVLDGIFGFFHLFRSANNSSRSL